MAVSTIKHKLILVVLLSVTSANNFDTPCHDLSTECLTKSLQAAIPNFVQGNPKYGLETLDPYIIDKLDWPGDMLIHFVSGHARGLKNCIVDYARLQGNILECQYHCNLIIKGKYETKGRILVFPIDGVGETTIKCRNLRINSALNLGSKIGVDGRKYLEIKSYNVTHKYEGRVSYNMTNLFRGNKEINKAVLNFMNSNWRMIAEEFGTPLVEYGINCVMRNLYQLTKVLSLDQLLFAPVDF